jgi:voltage-gated potassium channel
LAIISEKLRKKLHEVIYEADTPMGKLFDVVLLIVILISVVAVMLESVTHIRLLYGKELAVLEWIITIIFTLEYIARIISLRKPFNYIFSFYGIIDLLAMLPSYLDLLFPGWHFLLSIRALRLLRIFRVLKLTRFVGASNRLLVALRRSRIKIFVFLFTVIILCIILGTVMYMVEGEENGFTSIPIAVYWTIVTLTTVGFGDLTPVTPLGQFVATLIMIMGYGIIAVPTSLVTSELINEHRVNLNTQRCSTCNANNHRDDAHHCYRCGTPLHIENES